MNYDTDHTRKSSIVKLFCVVMMCLMLNGTSVLYAQEAKKPDKEKQHTVPTLSYRAAKRLNEVLELLNKKQYEAAKQTIAKLNMDELSPYERSKIEQILASIEQGQDHFDKARNHYQAAISAGGLNEQEVNDTRYYIAQLYIAEKHWQEGASALEDYFNTSPNPNSAGYFLLASCYYQMGDHIKAIAPAQKAVELAETPVAINLLVTLYMEQKQYTAAIPLLQQLIVLAPEKRDQWMQLLQMAKQPPPEQEQTTGEK